METALPYITEFQRKVIQETVSTIVESVEPEKIICYGLRTMSSQHWSSFTPGLENKTITSIDILIILHEKDKSKRESVSYIVENLSNDNIRLIPVVHSIDAVKSNLMQGGIFFVTLYRKGILLYDNNRVSLSVPDIEVSADSKQAAFNASNQQKAALARMFYGAACDCATDGRHSVAVFMLHQSVELTCNTLLRTCLGYRSTSHSIKKSLMLIENITLTAEKIFPRSTNEEAAIFNILQRAYSEVRYKDGYTVSADKVLILIERVSQFLTMSLTLCANKWSEISKQ